jgi:hypothetical protein
MVNVEMMGDMFLKYYLTFGILVAYGSNITSLSLSRYHIIPAIKTL